MPIINVLPPVVLFPSILLQCGYSVPLGLVVCIRAVRLGCPYSCRTAWCGSGWSSAFAPLGAVPSGPIINVRAARSDGSLEAEGASQVGPKAGAKHRA
jgi:allergen V5/tpx-1 related protein